MHLLVELRLYNYICGKVSTIKITRVKCVTFVNFCKYLHVFLISSCIHEKKLMINLHMK